MHGYSTVTKMRILVVLLLLVSINAESHLHKQEQENEQTLNPVNDIETQNEAKLQNKRTLGPTIFTAKHIGIHPSGFKYLLGYGPIGFAPYVKPITLLKPALHSHGWKSLVHSVPILKGVHLKAVLPTVHLKPIIPTVHLKPLHHHVHDEHHLHHVHHAHEEHPHVHEYPHVHFTPEHPHVEPVQPIVPVQPVEQPIVPVVTPTVIKPLIRFQPQVPLSYPFFKPLHNPLVSVQSFVPNVVQPLIPQLPLPQVIQPVQPVVQPAVQPVVHSLPHPVAPNLPVPPPLFHFIKQFAQVPLFRHVIPLIPVSNTNFAHTHVHTPELPSAHIPEVTLHTPQDAGIPVHLPEQPHFVPQIPEYLPEHPHLVPQFPGHFPAHPHLVPQIPGHLPEHPHFVPQIPSHLPEHPHLVPQIPVHPQPEFHGHIPEQHEHTDTPVIIPQPHVPVHPAPQTPLYLPPHPVFRPGVAQPVGPIEPTNSIQTELSATFPRHPLPGVYHPSITLEPPYGPHARLK